MKAVLTHKPSSIYDDLPWERYHFPKTYLRQMEQAVGDLIVYYEPRREGLMSRVAKDWAMPPIVAARPMSRRRA